MALRMRYRIRARDLASFHQLRELEKTTRVFVASEHRCLLSTGDLSEDVIRELRHAGADVRPDYQFEPDH
jgi:hypothetical protein